MGSRRTLTMNWDGLGDDDDDAFFESYNRLSTAVPHDLASSSDDEDDDFDDPRLSFVSAVSSVHSRQSSISPAPDIGPDYGVWMAAPISITERRKRLLHGMGLDENKSFKKATTAELGHVVPKSNNPVPSEKSTLSPTSTNPITVTPTVSTTPVTVSPKQISPGHSSLHLVLVRSRSEGDIELFSIDRSRREDLIGKGSKQRLTRTATEVAFPRAGTGTRNRAVVRDSDEAAEPKRKSPKVEDSDSGVRSFFLIKNLDTGKEFIVKECSETGAWNRLSDLQTGKQLTMDEFEKAVGKSRVVNELMRRGSKNEVSRKLSSSSYISRSLKMSKRRGVALLKNIKGVASGFIGEREREAAEANSAATAASGTASPEKSQWVRVRQSGKSMKEVSALHLCQEFQGHEGSVWTIRFSLDGKYLASAGEDKVIHVWEVQECEVLSQEGSLTPLHPSLAADKKKRSKFGSKRGPSIPDYVHVPETVFSLFHKPFCTFQGHFDEVLDLSWSKSQLLLSSSMDKTVRLWDLETRSCLNTFAHNDYVTCIQFNPIQDNYFISGSLDGKVRIWSIPERHVVDWTDIHEMVTAVSYTPDGQGALVGTHKGSCRTYSTEDCIFTQTGSIEVRHKKKSHLRKVTGFQFAPGNPSEILVTSADSRIRILDGSEVVQKYTGFRNANTQIAASFSPDGRYIISASEDSQVYVWKHEEHRKGRNLLVNSSHEHFHCKDVSVAIPWPCTIKGDPPLVPVHHSKWFSKRFHSVSNNNGEETASPSAANSCKRTLPPLPRKSNTLASEGSSNSPTEDSPAISPTESGFGDSFANSKRMMPQSPLKVNCNTTEEDDLEAISHIDSGFRDSFSSSSSSAWYSDAHSSSSSWSSTFSLLDSSHVSSTVLPSAWGLVIVTAGFGGEIRCYQNFGLPRRLSRQPHLFGGYNSFSIGNT